MLHRLILRNSLNRSRLYGTNGKLARGSPSRASAREKGPVHEQLGKVLIVDNDPDTLVKLQQLLEDAGVDATITWDQAEAQQLVESRCFDLILVGDHPPELDAATILRVVSSQAGSHPSLILRGIVTEEDVEHFRGLGT